MVRFDQSQETRLYLGFTKEKLDIILMELEKYRLNDEITSRINVLAESKG